MSFFGAKITGVKKLSKELKRIEKVVEKPILREIQNTVMRTHSIAVKSIRSTPKGDKYVRYSEPSGGAGQRREGRASAPGDPPHTDTGHLISHIIWEIDNKKLIGQVGTNLMYGLYLEKGTLTTAARPWLGPAYIKAMQSEKINVALQKSIKKSFKDK